MSNQQEGVAQGQNATASAQETLEKIRSNVARVQDEKRRMSSGFVKIEAGETKILQFTGDIDVVENTFTKKNDDGTEEQMTKKRFAYTVLDMSTAESQEAGFTKWTVSKQWSDMIDNFLLEQFLTLKVKREGAGTSTKYFMSPARQ